MSPLPAGGEGHMLEMMSQKTKRAKDKLSREPLDKGVTFTASSSLVNGKKNRTSSRKQLQLQLNHHRPTSIIQEQVPLWSARPEMKFPYIQAEELMQAHLPSKLAGVAYHPAQCAHLAMVLSGEIRDLVKAVTPPRYRLVCSVSIGSKGQDGVVVSSQSLWDPHADSFATSHYANPTLFCVALVHAIYLE
ncbi:dynein light chain Tctex-type protein 2B-like [Talpa occidentalis]|uniref:dynein light chain Tctex-type protein 2B-like n=1 Tax=Talpa occidentalis TaxID=50954 RepID=UPI00188E68EF|nr:dynein light chain Tctex-type protein 2B-like [Talpa occidentalis]